MIEHKSQIYNKHECKELLIGLKYTKPESQTVFYIKLTQVTSNFSLTGTKILVL